jgi:hypothetical protein
MPPGDVPLNAIAAGVLVDAITASDVSLASGVWFPRHRLRDESGILFPTN